jgi:hypothetical protein
VRSALLNSFHSSECRKIIRSGSRPAFALTWFLNFQGKASGSEVIHAESSHAWADGMMSAAVVGGIPRSEIGLDESIP